ncbi:MAG: hypothetical protein M1826_002038 [Phylliscum demangeonii]|nr:MAG: hypothetical protein M1826_002038 [Phylliscum demangeonii]
MDGRKYDGELDWRKIGPLPPKIKCARCKKIRNKDAFSNRQLGLLGQSGRRGGMTVAATHPTIKCRLCTAGQTTELTCIICTDTKALAEFSKAQRRDPDRARCLNCVLLHVQTEPGMTIIPEDGDDDDDGDGDGYLDGDESVDNEFEYSSQYAESLEDSNASLTLDKLTLSHRARHGYKTYTSSQSSRKPSVVSQEIVPPPVVAALTPHNLGLLNLSLSDTDETASIADLSQAESDWVTQPRRGRNTTGHTTASVYTNDGPPDDPPPPPVPASVTHERPISGRIRRMPPRDDPAKEIPTSKRGGFAKIKGGKSPIYPGIFAESARYGVPKNPKPIQEEDEDDDDDYMATL